RRAPRGSAEKSNSSASARCTVKRSGGNSSARRAARSRSISIAARCGMRASNSRVRAPSPGPISTIASSPAGAIESTIRRSTPGSCRKCWPKRLRGTCFAPRSRLLVFEPDLNVRLVAQLAQPVLICLVGLALAQRLARDQPLALRRDAAGPTLDDLDQVPAERTLHRLADFARLQRIHRALKLRHRVARIDPAQIAALGGAHVHRIDARDLSEIRAA